MNKSLELSCVVTGNKTIYAGDFLNKKIAEYGNEENLIKFYICKEVKAYLKKKYKISDIRKVLTVSNLIPLPSNEIINHLESKYSVRKSENTIANTITEFTYNKSDTDVEEFITKYIINS